MSGHLQNLSNISEMVFRLPTHLDSFVPPPSQQSTGQRPWRGELIVSGMRSSDRSSSQRIHVTAVETDGDNRVDLWPVRFITHITYRTILKDLQTWMKRPNSPPLCTFMPDRHRDPNINAVNQTNFRSLSRILFENQTVAVASWGSDEIPGAGVIIFPAQNTSSLLVGALFLTDPFPTFVTGTPSPHILPPPPPMHSVYGPQYQPQAIPYVTSSRHHHSSSSQHPMSYPTSPVDQPGSDPRQFRITHPCAYPTGHATLPPDSGWPDVKDEEHSFSPTHDTQHYG